MEPFTPSAQFRQDILAVLDAAVRAVDPRNAILAAVELDRGTLRIGARSYPLAGIDRVFVVGGGKAGAPMAGAIYELLGDRIARGSVNVKYEHTAGPGGWQVRYGRGGEPATPASRVAAGPISIIEAGHPVPDAAGLRGAEEIARLMAEATERDLVIVLISGGGSALLPLPVEGVSLADYQTLTNLLLRSGADITEINTVRKHCSRLQGGQLARLATPAQVVTLILSDVVGTPLDAIASGPTVPDTTTFEDAWAVLERYGITNGVPESICKHLRRGVTAEIEDTPKAGDSLFDRVNNVVIGDNAIAGRAAVAEAQRRGYHSALLSTFIQGEAREVGRVMAGLAQGIATGQSDYPAPACLIFGGETTVTIRGGGKGGRNQELVVSAALGLSGHTLPAGIQAAVVSLGTDGTDGPTDAAGGIGSLDTVLRAKAAGLDIRAALVNNDSYHFLGQLGDLLITGPTQTNVNDLIAVFVAWERA